MNYSKVTNYLINEKSPYLLQHAYNPVNWYPWGTEAFDKAKEENKPIFLSIGYSTCHWCHVMAHESFEDDEVSNILNSKFISIKVDREERPDIDSIYMKVCQMLTGHGGWPLSVFLTPNQQPFYAGTYFPKESRYGKPGFIDILNEIYEIYIKQPDKVTYIIEQISSSLNANFSDIKNESKLSSDILQKTFSQIESAFDKDYGGFGDSPKFPTPHLLMFLLKYNFLKKEDKALHMVTKTLDSMADGGIYDHIGFGFSRYSVDEKWLVPHFEKMLYDNALLLITYTEAYQITENERYKELCNQIIAFIEREMINKDGGFYSAIDADSEGIEGKYYVWEIDEVYNVLGKELGDIFCKTYNISETGNFEGKNIPNLINTDFDKIASLYNLKIEQLTIKLKTARQKLFEERKKRVFPHTDDKILTSWNALLVTSLAKASRITDKDKCLELANKSLAFIENNLIIDERIMVRYRDNEVKNKGYIDDYAFLLWSYIEMYESTFNLNYLKKAKQINERMISLFWDTENGGFYFYGNDAENLIIREKEIHDGAIPSGNGVAAYAIIKLANILGDISLVEITEQMFTTFKNEVESYPSGHSSLLESLIIQNLNKKEVVILGNKNDKDRQGLLQAINEAFLLNVSVLVAEKPEEFKDIADYATNYKMIDGKTTVYICENFSCKQPTTNINEVYKELKLKNNQYVMQ